MPCLGWAVQIQELATVAPFRKAGHTHAFLEVLYTVVSLLNAGRSAVAHMPTSLMSRLEACLSIPRT